MFYFDFNELFRKKFSEVYVYDWYHRMAAKNEKGGEIKLKAGEYYINAKYNSLFGIKKMYQWIIIRETGHVILCKPSQVIGKRFSA